MSKPTMVYATAEANRTLGIWIVTYVCWPVGGEFHKHSYSGGPTTGPPRDGVRTAPCGRLVDIAIR